MESNTNKESMDQVKEFVKRKQRGNESKPWSKAKLDFLLKCMLIFVLFLFVLSYATTNRYKEIDSGLLLDTWIDKPCYFNGHTGEKTYLSVD